LRLRNGVKGEVNTLSASRLEFAGRLWFQHDRPQKRSERNDDRRESLTSVTTAPKAKQLGD